MNNYHGGVEQVGGQIIGGGPAHKARGRLYYEDRPQGDYLHGDSEAGLKRQAGIAPADGGLFLDVGEGE